MMEEECLHCIKWNEYCRKFAEHFYWDHTTARDMHFCKTMTGDFSNSMIIPQKFIEHFKGELLETVELTVSSGDKWHVGLKNTRDGVVLEYGWNSFVAAYDIKENDLLVFKYDDSSSFHVLMFEQGGCEKPTSHFPKKRDPTESVLDSGKRFKSCAGSSPRHTEQGKPPVVDITHSRANKNVKERHTKRKLYNRISPRSTEHVLPSTEDLSVSRSNRSVRRKHSKTKTNSKSNYISIDSNQGSEVMEVSENPTHEVSNGMHGMQQSSPMDTIISRRAHLTDAEKERVISLSKTIQTDKPSFISIMVPCCVSKRFYMTIPVAFATKFLSGVGHELLLQLPETERTWLVKCLIQGRSVGLSSGWKEFVEDNRLKLGDICLFELAEIKGCKALNVHINRIKEDEPQLLDE